MYNFWFVTKRAAREAILSYFQPIRAIARAICRLLKR